MDVGLAYSVTWAIIGLVILLHRTRLMEAFRFYEEYDSYIGWAERTLWITYFALLEGVAGASLGKWMAGLRVSRADRGGPPGLLRGTIRTLVFYGLLELPADLVEHFAEPAAGPGMIVKFWAYGRLIQCLGALALIATMRRKSGFRGPHEWLSGTRVVQVDQAPYRPASPPIALADGFAPRARIDDPGGLSRSSSSVPTYPRDGRQNEDGKVLLGQDSSLDRPVWIVFRDEHTPPPPSPRAKLESPGPAAMDRRRRGRSGPLGRVHGSRRDCPWMRW